MEQMPSTYTLKPGDTFYKLSEQFRTTVQSLMELNPHLNPYNLRVGDRVMIIPEPALRQRMAQAIKNMYSKGEVDLSDDMRRAWLEHMLWTRLLVISITDDLGDKAETENRLLRNPYDIGKIYRKYYPAGAVSNLERLLTEHLTIGGALISAAHEGQTQRAEALNKRWYQNADQLALAYAALNPNYNAGEVRRLLHTHLDQTNREVALRLAGDYRRDVANFDQIEDHGLHMADYFTQGIVRQFPRRFA